MYHALTLAALLLFFSAGGLAAAKPPLEAPPAPPYTIVENQATIPLLSPDLAQRQTAKFVLSNGMQVYLIHDPAAEKSAAALTVQAGSWDDPVDHPGMAHFLEHMLFMGTAKYPEENEYDRFITAHGGQTNAFTSNDATSYLFSVDHEDFDGALDRFSNFFKEPLLSSSAVSRELNAIDQEYAKNLENDDIRAQHVLKVLTRPDHPERRFQMGNSKSLATTTPQQLRQWYNEHYSANLMHLVLYSSLPLEEQKMMVIRHFKGIANRQYQPTKGAASLYPDSKGGEIVFIEPVQNARSLTMRWLLPPKFSKMLDSHPEKAISYVLGHEGRSSLLAQLKREELARELTCGEYYYSGELRELYLEIELTEKGLKNYPIVIERVFQALAGLRRSGIPETVFNQLQRQQALSYQYQDRRDAFKEVTNHALRITTEDLSSYPEKTYLIKKYDAQAIQDLLKVLTPANCRIAILAPYRESRVKSSAREPYLGVLYSVKPALRSQYTRWLEAKPHPKIGLPEDNPFMPEDLGMLENGEQKPVTQTNRGIPVPELLEDSPRAKIYYNLDERYRVPKVSLNFVIRTPAVTPRDPKNSAMNDLFVKVLKAELAETAYQAQMAGLNYNIKAHDNGIQITINGFNDKAPKLLQVILDGMKHAAANEQHYRQQREALLREYADQALEPPVEQAIDNLKGLLFEYFAGEPEKESALRKVTHEQFIAFAKGLFTQNFLQGVIVGNIDKEVARGMVVQTQQQLGGSPYPSADHYQRRLLLLSEQGPYYWEENIAAQGNAVLLAIEAGPATFTNRAAQQIVMQALRESFFNALRTKQQTGYVVFTTAEELEGQLLNLFGVQSASHAGRDLLARYELFIEEYLKGLEDEEIPPERYEWVRNAFIKEQKQPPKDLQEMAETLHQLAFVYNGDFLRPTERLKAFEELDYDTFVAITRQMLGKGNHRRLGVILEGADPDNAILQYKRIKSRASLRHDGSYIKMENKGE